jgi:hypothetical protein
VTGKIKIVALGSVLAVSALGGGSLNREEYHRAFDKTVTVQNAERVAMEHKFGDIVIHTHPQQDVVIHADIRVSASDAAEAKQYADRVEILVEATSELFIRTRYPEAPKSFFGMHNISFSVHYDVTIPESSPLQVRNSFGAVFASGVKAGSELITSHGELKFQDGRGTQRLENSFARVEVDHNAGDVTVETTNGDVKAGDITGALSVRDRFAKVTAERVSSRLNINNGNGEVIVNDGGGDAEIKTSFAGVVVHNLHGGLIVNNNNGRVDATNITGAATLNTSFAEVTFNDIGHQLSIRSNNGKVIGTKVGGGLTIVNSFGGVQVSDIQHEVHIESGNADVTVDKTGGPADIKTSFGGVRATNIAGLLTVKNNNGSVKASTVQGAQVTTSFAAVILENVTGPVNVINQNGSVEVSSTTHESCQPLGIRTSFGAIRVRLQPEASYKVTAKTSFGKIRSDYPLTLQGSMSSDEVNGTIGGGRCEMSLVDQNSGIEILKP